MVFISSQLSLAELQTKSLEEIYNTDWFLFDYLIKSKKYHSDNNLNIIYNHLQWYPIFYKERIYNYLMSDRYYFSSSLYNIFKGYAQITCMNKAKELHEITDHDKEVIRQEDRLFGEKNIKKMMNCFERNNYRKNPICEYVLG